MARRSRWSNFADAFNSVYGVTTTIGRDFETGRVLRQEDWQDAEGNALSGDALQRARYDALARIEEKYGSAQEALNIRTGFEDYQTKSLNNSLLTDTYDDRVYQTGEGATRLLNSSISLNSANAGLAGARTRGVNLDNDFTSRTLDGRVNATNTEYSANAARNAGLATAYSDPSYPESLVASQNQTTADAGLATQQANQTLVAQAQPDFVDAFNDQTVTTAQQRAVEAETGLANARTDLGVAIDPVYQGNLRGAAVAQSSAGLADAQNNQLNSERRRDANQFLTDWAQTADQSDPDSVATLVQGIKALDPQMGMELEQRYGEHELWRIANDSVSYKAEANAILSQEGLEGLRAWIDNSNGNDGVVIEGGDDGGPVRLVETDPEGNATRVIAEGRDGREFRENLQGYLDPTNMLAISEQQYENQLKAAQAEFAQAQARARGSLSLDEFIAGRLSQNPRDPLALALAFKANPEAYAQLAEQLEVQGLIDAASGNAGAVPNPTGNTPTDDSDILADPVTVPGATTDPVVASNQLISQVNDATQDMSVEDRAAYIENNRDLLERYSLYQPEVAKLAAATRMASAIQRQSANEFLQGLSTFATSEPIEGRGSAANRENRQLAAAQLQAIQESPEILQIVLRDMQTGLEAAQQSAGTAGDIGRNATRRVRVYEQRIQELEALIQQLQQN